MLLTRNQNHLLTVRFWKYRTAPLTGYFTIEESNQIEYCLYYSGILTRVEILRDGRPVPMDFTEQSLFNWIFRTWMSISTPQDSGFGELDLCIMAATLNKAPAHEEVFMLNRAQYAILQNPKFGFFDKQE